MRSDEDLQDTIGKPNPEQAMWVSSAMRWIDCHEELIPFAADALLRNWQGLFRSLRFRHPRSQRCRILPLVR